MKRIVIILIGLISVAYGQSSPTSAKTRFVNGLYVGTKLDSYFAAADSNAIYWRADSVVMAKYKGAARALAFAVSGGYIPYSDTTSLLSQVVRTFGTQTIYGPKTFTNTTRSTKFMIGSPTDTTRAFSASGNGNDISMVLEEYGGASATPEIFFYKGRGSVSSKSNVVVTDGLGGIVVGGYLNTALKVSGGASFIASNLNTTDSIVDADFVIEQTYNGTTLNRNFTVSANGGHAYNRGNYYLGVSSPAAWSGRTALQIPSDGYIVASGANVFFGTNTYFNGSARTYISTAAAAMYRQVSGQHRWEVAASGTANTSISFTQAMTLTTNSELLVNTTTADGVNKAIISGGLKATTVSIDGGTSTQALIADGSVQTLTSGTYTPTVTNITNTASNTPRSSQWMRVGNTVTVSGDIEFTSTATGLTQFTISLPVASAFANSNEAAGTGTFLQGGVLIPSALYGYTPTSTVIIESYTTATSATRVRYHFTYRVI